MKKIILFASVIHLSFLMSACPTNKKSLERLERKDSDNSHSVKSESISDEEAEIRYHY